MPVALWGPREAWNPPPDSDWYLLVADETGLPAVAAILERLPAGIADHVVAEVDSPDERQELPEVNGIEVTWRYRGGAAPGTTTLLLDAVRQLPWPAGAPYALGGAESHAMATVRRHLRQERGLDRSRVDMIAYWRHAAHPIE